jgi:tetratricopeptide (TPR) repeat protein
MPGGDFTGRGDLEAAIADYTEALRLDPERAAFYAGRAFARQKLAVARFFARVPVGELFGAAMKDLEEAIRREPSDAACHRQKAEAMFEVGVYALYRGDPPREWYAGAVKEYEETSRLEPALAPLIESGLKTCRDRAGEAPAAVPPEPGIVWAKTFELGQREARIRRVPILFYVSGGAG